MSGAAEDFLTSETMRKHQEAMARADAGLRQTERLVGMGSSNGRATASEGEESGSNEPYIVEVTDDDEGSTSDCTDTAVNVSTDEEGTGGNKDIERKDVTDTIDTEEVEKAEKGEPGEAAVEEEEEKEEEKEEELSPEELDARVTHATTLKMEGNELYKQALWEGAISKYSEALEEVGLPRRHEARAALYCNRAAARAQLHLFQEVVTDCDAALELQPSYLKARLRKAQALEDLEKLSDALKEYEAALKYSPTLSVAKKAVARLPKAIEEKQKRDQEEMMGKLKEMGNSLLGLVGLSLDNFQFTQDPNTGGYSVSMSNQ